MVLKWITFMMSVMFSTMFSVCFGYEILSAYNCGSSQNISTKMVNYSKDDMFSAFSKEYSKDNIPINLAEQERELLKTQRSSQISFFYNFKLQKNGHYMVIMKFIEMDHKIKGQRVFNLKIGDEITHVVDIVGEVGFGEVLHKWIQFDVEDQIIYLNGTYPVLNGYKIKELSGKIHFEKVKGAPKVEAIILVRGNDSQKFLSEYLQSVKKTKKQRHSSQKYRIPPKNIYPILDDNQVFHLQDETLLFYIKKIFSIKVLVSFLCVILILYYDETCMQIKKFISFKQKQE